LEQDLVFGLCFGELDLFDQLVLQVGALDVEEGFFIKYNISCGKDDSLVRDLDPVDICWVISNEVSDVSSWIQLHGLFLLELGLWGHGICPASICFKVRQLGFALSLAFVQICVELLVWRLPVVAFTWVLFHRYTVQLMISSQRS
jgi:hypothetical protein